MLPPPQDAPIKYLAKRELKSCAQIKSLSSSSSEGIELGCKGILSQGAPLKKMYYHITYSNIHYDIKLSHLKFFHNIL